MLRVAVVAMVKNEADILPAWLSNIARWAEFAVLIDHGSSDGSTELMHAAAHRRKWEVWHESNPAYHQEAYTTRAVEHAFALGADWVLPLDADELLQVSGRAELAARLADVPLGATGALHWMNCIPARDAGMWWFTPWRAGTCKAAIPRALWRPGVSLPLGNHHLEFCGEKVRSSYAADLLHFPLRSVAQMRHKIEQGVEALRLRGDDGGPFQQWRWGAAALKAGVDHELLSAWACRYPCPPLPGFERITERDFSRWGWRCGPGPRCGAPCRELA